jgi:hypothetical protein
MACSKYTLTNTGSTIITFNYQRCDDALWQYQNELLPGEVKNIWLLDNTYSSAFPNKIVLVDLGTFPFTSQTPTPSITPSPTPTPSTTAAVTPTPTPSTTADVTPTPTNTETPTQTPTPTNTETPTQTPTNTPTPTETDTPTRTAFSLCHSETSSIEACSCSVPNSTIFGNDPVFTNNTQFYGCVNGPCPGVDLSGWYVFSGVSYQLSYSGSVVGFSACAVTPTPTPTNTETPTATPTPTSTPMYVEYSLGTGLTANSACTASFQSIYGSPAQIDGPDYGETLYVDSALTITVPNGYYSNGTLAYQVDGSLGAGVIMAAVSC